MFATLLQQDSNVLMLVHRFGQDAKAVAGAVREGVKQVYYIADGAEGPRGWKVIFSQSGSIPAVAPCHNCTLVALHIATV